jgi:hypothetical protein
MLRLVVGALTVAAVCAGTLAAEEFKGKIKALDLDKMTLIVTVDETTDRTVTLEKETKVRGPNGLVQKDGLKSSRLKVGQAVIVTYENREGKDVCTQVRIEGKKPKK